MSTLESLSLLTFAFTAGAFTFFAPCAYPMLPGYVSYYLGLSTDQSTASRPDDAGDVAGGHVVDGLAAGFGLVVPAPTNRRLARAVGVGVLVSAGFVVVYGLLAGVVTAVGARVLASVSLLEFVVGAFLVVAGSAMGLGWEPSRVPTCLPERRRSAVGYVGFGVLYAAAAAGCTAPIFVAVALRGFAAGPVRGVAAFAAYSAGMSALMVGVTVLTALGREAVLRHLTSRMDLIYRLAGVLLVVAGVAEIYFFLFQYDGLRLLGLG